MTDQSAPQDTLRFDPTTGTLITHEGSVVHPRLTASDDAS